MTAHAPEIGDRIADKLKSQARAKGIDIPQYLQKYAQERIACRLFAIPDAEDLMITGGAMYQWCPEMIDLNRSTADIDLKTFTTMSHDAIVDMIKTAASIEDSDGCRIDVGRLQELEHSHGDHTGLRVNVAVYVGKTRVATHLDFSIGGERPLGMRDLTVTPMIAGQTTSTVRAQPWTYSAAEKLHSIVVRGMENTRLKDYRDLFVLARKGYGDKTDAMREAVESTFRQRDTELPDLTPEGLTMAYAVMKQAEWERYLDRNGIEGMPRSLAAVVAEIEVAFGSSVRAERVYGYCP